MRLISLPRRAFVPVALATAAVISLSSTATAAEDAPCGQAAVPAAYATVVHPAVVTTIPAVTHVAWRWERLVATTELEFSRVVTHATGRWSWSREVDTIESDFVRTVVDREWVPALPEAGHLETRVITPAVTEEEWEYLQQTTGNTRWEREGWNAGDKGKGWSPTGVTRQREVVPAVTEQVWIVDRPAVPEVPELSHQEHTWVAEGDPAPAGSTATGASRISGSVLETTDLPDGEVPSGSGWVKGAWVEATGQVTDEIWLAEGDAAPVDYAPTGATRAGTPRHEESASSATAPEGGGWTQVPGSEQTVVDVAAHDREDLAAWTEQVLVTPEVPATDACEPTPTDETDSDDDDVDPEVGPEVVVVDLDDEPEDGTVDGEVADTVQAAPVAVRTETVAALPATGAGTEPWLLALGVFSVVAGAGLVRRSAAPVRVSTRARR